MSENKNDMSFADKIARGNMQAVADAHNHLLKRVEVLEQENKEQWKFIMALSDDVARHNLTESDMHSLNRKLKEYMEFAEVDNETD